jgi:hypothetical protein
LTFAALSTLRRTYCGHFQDFDVSSLEGGEADNSSLRFARQFGWTKPKEVMTKPAHLSSIIGVWQYRLQPDDLIKRIRSAGMAQG